MILLAGVAMFAATNIDNLFLTAALLADRALRPRAVVLGTFMGIGALFVASALGSLVSLVVPPWVIALLGFVPVAIGVRQLRSASSPESVATKGGGVLTVAALNVAIGADNIGVYLPVFAAASNEDIAAYGAIFAVLTGLWCYGAYALVRNPALGAPVRRYAPRLLPYVLIALGLWILSGLF